MPAQKRKSSQQPIASQEQAAIDVVSITVVDDSTVEVEPAAQPAQLGKPRRRGRHPAVKRPATSPDLFTDGSIDRMASNRLIWEGCNILTQGESLGWTDSGEGSACYSIPVAKGKGFVSFWVTNELFAKQPGALEGEAAIALIEQFDIRAACMHLIYAAHATQLDRPWEQSFVLNDTQVERYLGLDQNRNFKNKQEKLQFMLELAKQPCHLLVYVSWPDQGRVKAFTVSRTWLWEMTEPMLHFQECLSDDNGEAVGEKQLVGFTLRVRCGYWANHFLNPDRLLDKSGYYEYSILTQGLLHDIMSTWHHYEGAARLITWLLFKVRVNRSSPIVVETLMKVAFGEKFLEEAKAGYRQRSKLTRSWTISLKVLHEKGWTLTPDLETYPLQYWFEDANIETLAQVPDDPEQAAAFWSEDAAKPKGQRLTDKTKRSKEAFEQLLASKIWVRPPAAIAEKLDELDRQRAAQRDKLAAKSALSPASTTESATDIVITGEWVRQKRTAKKLSQRDLANLTGISQKMISMIENGDRVISSTNQERLLKAFPENL
ncbi:helix-turn-helix transcriptional regulator [Microcoleus sp. FACHB-1515]|uniref:helix-turn-helix domain-containing protein n=1 Tax=Cyanophyceae TaxID=3028117 RepID=UPI001688864C|nr:helix-turn-helix transcriptional regulator [Microcoleus sp. FACHB-1515]MBD2093450.1 helix-turn-helix transcriptional regulator [Microcoleus sp. FACHB-1515]